MMSALPANTYAAFEALYNENPGVFAQLVAALNHSRPAFGELTLCFVNGRLKMLKKNETMQ
jgi:hypothetical protein